MRTPREMFITAAEAGNKAYDGYSLSLSKEESHQLALIAAIETFESELNEALSICKDETIFGLKWTQETPSVAGYYWYTGLFKRVIKFFEVSIETSGVSVFYLNGNLVNCKDFPGYWMPAKVPALPK